MVEGTKGLILAAGRKDREEREALITEDSRDGVFLSFLVTGINDSGHALTLCPCHSYTCIHLSSSYSTSCVHSTDSL